MVVRLYKDLAFSQEEEAKKISSSLLILLPFMPAFEKLPLDNSLDVWCN